ncbi:hypothetical protein NW765_017244 [Fusarium oxysporum]|nr:hypothetical protein NW765_017244 [Fusarium oxysporum]
MRLLSAEDLQFEEFFGREIPKYAILSHRWEKDEPSYADMKIKIMQRKAWRTGQESPWASQIYQKIYQFSLVALQAGYKYIWVDTCCIDKSSSAELQESINSMYQWYMESGVCYAYLSDVSISTSPINTRQRGSLSSRVWIESFQNSQWFTRGWTLQELLAPRDLVFFDKDWNRCGNRVELQVAIQAATGIDAASLINASLKDGTFLRSIRIGRIFSWAASRQTTRREDRAYSLLGLFNIHMPLLYGEKDRAFYRLQEEIIKEGEDASLLAWAYTEADDGFAPNADMTVKVVRCKWHINLAYATNLAQRRDNRESCKLPDQYGDAISTAEIISISHATSLWVSEAENDLDKAISRPRKDVEVRTLGIVKEGSFLRRM